MTILDYLRLWQYLPSREGRQMFASGSELRRWIANGSVEVDGEKATSDTPFPMEDQRVVIHPNGKHRATLQ